MSIALILAAGSQRRWEGSGGIGPKQMVDIEGEPLLARTIRQIKPHVAHFWIVTQQPDIVAAFPDLTWYKPHRWTVEAVSACRERWGLRTIVLLGDVLYGAKAMYQIVTDKQRLTFYGDTGEIFALSFMQPVWEPLQVALDTAIEHAESGARHKAVGKLWSLYRAWCGLPLNVHEGGADKCFRHVTGTRDFDYLRDYEEYRAELNTSGALSK